MPPPVPPTPYPKPTHAIAASTPPMPQPKYVDEDGDTDYERMVNDVHHRKVNKNIAPKKRKTLPTCKREAIDEGIESLRQKKEEGYMLEEMRPPSTDPVAKTPHVDFVQFHYSSNYAPVECNEPDGPSAAFEAPPLVMVKVKKGTEATLVKMDASKYRFLSILLKDETYVQQFVNTDEVIADLTADELGSEFAADIAVMLDVSEGWTTVTSARIAAQTLRGADYMQVQEELYLEQVVGFFLADFQSAASTTSAAEDGGGESPRTATTEVVPCVHTGQLMWDRLGAYHVLKLEQKGIISFGHKGAIDARDSRIDDELLALANTMNNVTSLDISGNATITQFDAFLKARQVVQAYHEFTDASAGVASYGRLKYLDVRAASNISDASIMAVAQHCPHLHHLNVSETKGAITDTSISCIAQHCRCLVLLSVRETCGAITDTSISSIAQHCSHLQHLNVSETCGAISDTSISSIAQHCSHLRQLDVSLTNGKISDTSISSIAQHCQNLVYLIVSGTCGAITDTSISCIAEHCPYLQHLDVSETKGAITDTSISSIAQHCSHLRQLDVSLTKGAITDTSISSIAQHCSHLRQLDVSLTNGKITDTSIKLIAHRCSQLQHLKVFNAGEAITDVSIALILQHCQQLEYLDVRPEVTHLQAHMQETA